MKVGKFPSKFPGQSFEQNCNFFKGVKWRWRKGGGDRQGAGIHSCNCWMDGWKVRSAQRVSAGAQAHSTEDTYFLKHSTPYTEQSKQGAQSLQQSR